MLLKVIAQMLIVSAAIFCGVLISMAIARGEFLYSFMCVVIMIAFSLLVQYVTEGWDDDEEEEED